MLASILPLPKSEASGVTSYAPVDIKEAFSSIMSRMHSAQADLLGERYDLSNRPA